MLGCLVVLTLLGAAAAVLGSALSAYQQVLERVGGVLLILFGIVLTGLIRIPWVSGDYRAPVTPGRSAWWRSGLIGMAFAASWSACSGPILAGILVLTAVRSMLPLQGAISMLTFALGQGVPFLLAGILVDRSGTLLRRIHRFTPLLSKTGGATLMLMGILLLTGLFSAYG